MTEEINNPSPYITLDGVNISVEDLPEEGQAVFGRLQRLIQKKANQSLDLEETNAAINFFSNQIVAIVNEGKEPNSEEAEAETVEVVEEEDSE